MKKVKKLLAVILTASMLLGNTGIAYAAETTVSSSEEAAAEEQRSDAGSGQEAAEVEEESVDHQDEQQTTSVVAETASSAVTALADAAAEASEAASTEDYLPEESAGEEETEEEVPSNDADTGETEEASSEEASAEETSSESASAEETSAESVLNPDATEAATEAVEKEKFSAGELFYKGSGYSVTLAYDEKAEIPANAQLKVREIKKGTSEYESYLAGAEAVARHAGELDVGDVRPRRGAAVVGVDVHRDPGSIDLQRHFPHRVLDLRVRDRCRALVQAHRPFHGRAVGTHEGPAQPFGLDEVAEVAHDGTVGLFVREGALVVEIERIFSLHGHIAGGKAENQGCRGSQYHQNLVHE